MKTRIKIFLTGWVLAMGCSLGLTIPGAVAEETKPAQWIQVSPVSQKLDLKPGERQTASIKVTNVGGEKFSFKVYASPYFLTDMTAEPVFETDSQFTKLASWVGFDQAEYIDLAPGAPAVEVPYYVDVPADVAGGGQYAVIFAEILDNNTQPASGSSIKTVSRVGSIIYAHLPGDVKFEGELVSFEQAKFVPEQPMKSSAVVKNTGNVDFSIQYNYTVNSIFGKELFKDEQSRMILPGISMQLGMEWDGPMFGIFKVTNNISFLGAAHVNETQLIFVSPLWLTVLLCILIVVILATATLLIVRAVKRRRGRRL